VTTLYWLRYGFLVLLVLLAAALVLWGRRGDD
jgi:hypothetical protein